MKLMLNAMVLGSALLALSLYAAEPTASGIPADLANPTTAADHQRLAEYFSQKAAALESDADWHDKMPRLYATATKHAPGTVQHCRALHDKLTAEADQARAAALAHYKIAALADK